MPGTVCCGPLTRAIRRRPTSWRWRTASAAPRRDFVRTLSTGVPFGGVPSTMTGAADRSSSRACASVKCSATRISPSTKRCLRSRIIASSSSASAPVECSSNRTPISRETAWIAPTIDV